MARERERELEHLGKAAETLGEFPFVVGAAADDGVLRHAGIERAAGLIACLTDDKENLYVTLTARRLNPGLRIVSKVIDANAGPKLQSAGANAVVNPTFIGGLRMVSEMFESAKRLITASVRSTEPDISETELRVRIFDRLYVDDFDEATKVKLRAALRRMV